MAISDAWVLVGGGAGLYCNLETGLKRKFCAKPSRGKWELIAPARVYLHLEGNVIHFARRRDQRPLGQDGGSHE